MRIDVLPYPPSFGPSLFRNKTALVIDVLRATTTMVTALGNGAAEIWAASSIAEARKLLRSHGRKDVLLCGERGGHRIPGFDRGNSPLEFTPKTVSGKKLIMATTNGTKAVRRAEAATAILIASFCNASAAAAHIGRHGRDTVILCSGKEGVFSLEDAACAGMVISKLRKKTAGLSINDLAVACEALYIQWKDRIPNLLAAAEHGRYLVSVGHGEDLEICAKVDLTKAVPVWKKGRIVLER